MTMHEHSSCPSRIWTLFYADGDNNDLLVLRAPSAKGWQWVIDDTPAIAQFREIIGTWDEASRDDCLWLADILSSADEIVEGCAYDLHRHGAIGVTS